MQITPRYRGLYQRALTIRDGSQSTRIREKRCIVCLGVTDPATTEYAFVGLNPGGDVSGKQALPTTELTMRDYVAQRYRYQQRAGEVIRAFAVERRLPAGDAFPMFGAVNFSFYHSGSVAPGTFYLEAAECRTLLLEELDLPRLRALIFTGRECLELFYLTLWKVGAEVQEVDTTGSGFKDVDPKGSVVATTLVTGCRVTCVFTQHLSPHGRPLAKGFAAKLGSALSRMTV